MLKVGKLEVVWGCWFQTYSIFDKVIKLPFIPIILIWRGKPDVTSTDRDQKYPLGTLLEQDGRRFRYWKASDDVNKGKLVENHNEMAVQ